MLQIYKKIYKFATVVTYFSKQSWNVKDGNYRNLCDKMTAKDKEIFFCDIKNLDWNEFFESYVMGIRIYILKDPLETLEAGRLHLKR